ncbi:D-lactate dehydrogenase [Lentithecium fluviatile CBS 122367]|uniref:D-lactate dehydrogenase (cytochrome) n=1 Tax=Lentithecium fluviatile CBS 122367 TaxID=1168545 RepID=A0A6G1JI61_9PLEO|nr:D-lactate dehydrogenase [Lentithecium fluviatile CBS 122367]
MADWVISLTCVLADGTVVKTRNRPRKSSAGYDLTHLIIGSEGTLALVTEAILRVTPLPKNLHVGVVTFETLEQGVNTAIGVLKSGVVVEAIELVDTASIHAINRSGLAQIQLTETPTLFLKFAGSSVQIVEEQLSVVRQLAERSGATAFEVSKERQRIEVIWGARKCLGNALVAMKKDSSDLFLSTDAAVPISKMARLVEESDRIVRSSGNDWFCASVGHVGDGNVHTAIICPAFAKTEAEALLEKIQRLALDLEGTITGEHGVGMKLRDLLGEEVGEEGVGMMRRVKMALDPRCILNPDKVVRLEEDV